MALVQNFCEQRLGVQLQCANGDGPQSRMPNSAKERGERPDHRNVWMARFSATPRYTNRERVQMSQTQNQGVLLTKQLEEAIRKYLTDMRAASAVSCVKGGTSYVVSMLELFNRLDGNPTMITASLF